MWSNVENASTDVLTVYLNWATTYAILVATPRPHKAITLPLQTFLLHSPCPAGINSTVLTRSPADLFCRLGVVSRARADCPQLCLGDLAEQTLCHPYPPAAAGVFILLAIRLWMFGRSSRRRLRMRLLISQTREIRLVWSCRWAITLFKCSSAWC